MYRASDFHHPYMQLHLEHLPLAPSHTWHGNAGKDGATDNPSDGADGFTCLSLQCYCFHSQHSHKCISREMLLGLEVGNWEYRFPWISIPAPIHTWPLRGNVQEKVFENCNMIFEQQREWLFISSYDRNVLTTSTEVHPSYRTKQNMGPRAY